ncbi:MAG: ribbon-helix-helix protein, CopG family [Actinomycetota bacterium]
MTMMSFRVDDTEAALASQWAERLGIDRSELLREALHRHLVRLAAEGEITAWEASPLTEAESSLGAVADWGPAEDWADWDVDATR